MYKCLSSLNCICSPLSLGSRSVYFYLFELQRAVKMPDHSPPSLPANPLKDKTFIAKCILLFRGIVSLFGKCAQQSRFRLRNTTPTHKTAGKLGQISQTAFILTDNLLTRFTKAVLTVPDESLQLTNEKPTKIRAMLRINVCRL